MAEDNVKQDFSCNFGIRIKKKDQSNSLHLSSKHCKEITWIQSYLSLCRSLYKAV